MRHQLVLVAAWATAAVPVVAEHTVDFKVVVAADHPTTSMPRDELAEVFLRKTETWKDGTPAFPVDQSSDSPVRKAFTRAVHGGSVVKVQSFWQRIILAGYATPPPEASSDEQVFEFVDREEGAVGYVSADATLAASFRVLDIPDLEGYDAAAFTPGRREGEDVTVSRHGELRLLLTGSCGPGGEGRQAVLENGSSYDTLTAKIETAVWVDDWFRSSSSSRHVLAPQEEERLGCSRRSGGADWRYAIVEVSSTASYELVPLGHEGPARSAVDMVASGSCGAGRGGQWRSLVNRHPYRQISIAVEISEEVDGGGGRRYRKTLRLAPGATKRLGCSADGKLMKQFTVLEAKYR